jgi:hypothetical protein
MSKWEKTKEGLPDSTIDAMVGYKEFEFKNKDTGETKRVVAFGDRSAGEKIAKGEFKKK